MLVIVFVSETFLFMIVDLTRQASATFFYPLKHPDLVFFSFFDKNNFECLAIHRSQILNCRDQSHCFCLFFFVDVVFVYFLFCVSCTSQTGAAN